MNPILYDNYIVTILLFDNYNIGDVINKYKIYIPCSIYQYHIM